MKRLFNVKKHFAISVIMATAMMFPCFAYAATGFNNCKHRISDNKCIGGCESYVIEYDYTANQGSSKQGIKLNSTAGDFGDAVYRGTAQVGGKWYWFFDRVVTHIESGAFDKKKMEINLSEIELPEGVTTLDPDVFAGCVTLENITLPSTLTTIGSGAFSGCSNLQEITIPEGVTTIEPNAFSGCTSLESVTLPSTVTSIGEGAFNGCSDLDNITIPENVTSIGAGAFSGCSDLTSVVIPDNVTTVGDNAFSGCTSLESVTVGEGVTNIGQNAFSGCENLTDVTMNSCPDMADNSFPAKENGEKVSVPLHMNDMSAVAEAFKMSANAELTSITYTRQMSGNWGTICLPFEVESNDDVKFYELTNISLEPGNEVLVFSEIVGPVPANTPCVMQKLTSDANLEVPAVTNNLVSGSLTKALAPQGWYMIGTYELKHLDVQTKGSVDFGKTIYGIYGNQFSRVASSANVKPFRAYFEYRGGTNAAPSRFSISVNEYETTLNRLVDKSEIIELYDLLGNRVNRMIKGRIYIMNGKKVMFK